MNIYNKVVLIQITTLPKNEKSVDTEFEKLVEEAYRTSAFDDWPNKSISPIPKMEYSDDYIRQTDTFVKRGVTGIKVALENLNIVVQETELMNNKWENIKVQLKKYLSAIDRLVSITKILSLPGCTVALLCFFYKIGWYRQLPSWTTTIVKTVGGVISEIPTSFSKKTETVVEQSLKEKIFNLIDIPITMTPTLMLSTIGVMSTLILPMEFGRGIMKFIRK